MRYFKKYPKRFGKVKYIFLRERKSGRKGKKGKEMRGGKNKESKKMTAELDVSLCCFVTRKKK